MSKCENSCFYSCTVGYSAKKCCSTVTTWLNKDDKKRLEWRLSWDWMEGRINGRYGNNFVMKFVASCNLSAFCEWLNYIFVQIHLWKQQKKCHESWKYVFICAHLHSNLKIYIRELSEINYFMKMDSKKKCSENVYWCVHAF